jgi:hypothetical protein
MDRREFLTAGKKSGTAILSISKTAARTYSGLNLYTGTWTKNEVVHLLKRTMFGAKRLMNYSTLLLLCQALL